MTIIDLMRHGEAAPGVCLGATFDAPMTDRGWSQMHNVLVLATPPWNGIVSSPLLRCAAFANEFSEFHGLPLRFDPRLRELGFGAWEGRSWSELYGQEGGRLVEFQRNPGFNPAPGGEDYQDFVARVADAWNNLLVTAHGGHWLVVTHAGVLRAILQIVLGFPEQRLFSLHVPYAGLTRIEQKYDYPCRLVFHGGRL